ncbi:MAG: twin-arginine translocation signal domain-containing protein [Planctomycetota bacterium]
MNEQPTRRQFLGTTAAAAATWAGARTYAAEADAKPGPNEWPGSAAADAARAHTNN